MFGNNYFNSIFMFILATTSMGQMKWQTYFKVAPNELFKILSNPKTQGLKLKKVKVHLLVPEKILRGFTI